MNRSLRILLFTIVCCLTFNITAAQSRKGVSILGDSYSTFKGFVTPEKNRTWYSTVANPEKTDVNEVSQTWWHQLIRKQGYRLVTNNSYSGATICNSGYSNNDYSDRSFVTRLKQLGSPDIIYIIGGTNDDWAKSPMGEYKYADWTAADLYQVRPATAYLVASILDYYPGTEVTLIINSEMRPDVAESLETIAKHYGIGCVKLHDIDKRAGHPTVKGMAQIATQIASYENSIRK